MVEITHPFLKKNKFCEKITKKALLFCKKCLMIVSYFELIIFKLVAILIISSFVKLLSILKL